MAGWEGANLEKSYVDVAFFIFFSCSLTFVIEKGYMQLSNILSIKIMCIMLHYLQMLESPRTLAYMLLSISLLLTSKCVYVCLCAYACLRVRLLVADRLVECARGHWYACVLCACVNIFWMSNGIFLIVLMLTCEPIKCFPSLFFKTSHYRYRPDGPYCACGERDSFNCSGG